MAEPIQRHQVKGEHVFEDRVFCHTFPRDILHRIKYEFELRDEDVLFISYPKSGSTWFQEIIWLLMNNCDLDKAKKSVQEQRIPFLERAPKIQPSALDAADVAESPRLLKSHLDFDFFSRELKTNNKKTKVVLGVRNIKDVLVSYYHFYRMNQGFNNMTGPFEEFFQMFKDKRLVSGDWFDHILSYWNNRHECNLFLLKYEELHKDLHGSIKQLATFLGKDISEEKLEVLAKHVSFDEMKENEMVNKKHITTMKQEISPFMRKGKVGDWKNHFTEEQNQFVDQLYRERIEGTGFEIDFDIE